MVEEKWTGVPQVEGKRTENRKEGSPQKKKIKLGRNGGVSDILARSQFCLPCVSRGPDYRPRKGKRSFSLNFTCGHFSVDLSPILVWPYSLVSFLSLDEGARLGSWSSWFQRGTRTKIAIDRCARRFCTCGELEFSSSAEDIHVNSCWLLQGCLLQRRLTGERTGRRLGRRAWSKRASHSLLTSPRSASESPLHRAHPEWDAADEGGMALPHSPPKKPDPRSTAAKCGKSACDDVTMAREVTLHRTRGEQTVVKPNQRQRR